MYLHILLIVYSISFNSVLNHCRILRNKSGQLYCPGVWGKKSGQHSCPELKNEAHTTMLQNKTSASGIQIIYHMIKHFKQCRKRHPAGSLPGGRVVAVKQTSAKSGQYSCPDFPWTGLRYRFCWLRKKQASFYTESEVRSIVGSSQRI